MNLCLSVPHLVHVEPLTGVAEVLNWEGPDESEDFIHLICFFRPLCCESDECCFTSNVKPCGGAEPVTFQGRCLVAVGEKKVGVLSNGGVSLHCMSRPAGDKHLTESVGGGRVRGCRRSAVIAHVELQQTLSFFFSVCFLTWTKFLSNV